MNNRPCEKCIYHDGHCHHWNCEPITRNEAEAAVRALKELAKVCEPHDMICDGDLKGVLKEIRKEEQ